jgi:hypothetical protein
MSQDHDRLHTHEAAELHAPTELSEQDAESINSFMSGFERLLAGELSAIGFQQKDAYSQQSEIVRDEAVRRLSERIGVDIDHHLTENEQPGIEFGLGDIDREALGIDPPADRTKGLPVKNALMRLVSFGVVDGRIFNIRELEFDNMLMTPEGTTKRKNRIINVFAVQK